MLQKRIALVIGIFLIFGSLYAQKDLNITIVYDRNEAAKMEFQGSIQGEIESLLGQEYSLHFNELFTGGDLTKSKAILADIYEDKSSDVLIGAGLITSKLISERSSYPIPTIAAINLDNLFTDDFKKVETSSIDNFTYIQSPFNIKKDIEVFSQIGDVKKVAVLVDLAFEYLDYNVEKYFLSDTTIQYDFIPIKQGSQETLDLIGEDVDAVYILSSLAEYSPVEVSTFFNGIAARNIPSLALLDYPSIDLGAYAAFSSKQNLQKIPRRIAIYISRIAEGKNPKDFEVNMESVSRQLIINMEVVNKTGVYPNWTILDNALLVNVGKSSVGRELSLKSAIAEGLENNLSYQIAKKQTQLVEQDVKLAKSNYLPQLDVSSSGLFLDEQTVSSSFGSRGAFNWSAGASFSQLILSEPALANISIQKLLKESQERAQRQTELDVVLDVVSVWFSYQQLLALIQLNDENVKLKNQNLIIARDKVKVGYSGESDVYRWETELALAKTDFNSSEAQLKSVQYQLNQILNRPVDEDFEVVEADKEDYLNQLFDARLSSIIENPGTLKLLSDFLADEAHANMPELKQIELSLQAQQRMLKSNKRAMYMPSVAFVANYDYPISIVNAATPPPIPGLEFTLNPTWNASFVASIPIFTGNSRRQQIKKSELSVYQLEDQQQDLKNKLELQVRSNLEMLQTSLRNVQLNNKAADSAKNNVDIVQDLYNEGQINITTLIDAQNAYFSAEINATNSLYTFLTDLFVLERSTGKYLSLGTEEQRNDFISRFLVYKSNNQ